ncbi:MULTISPECIES: DODA-type extradiol aromatic ring-opening family dioxygenase [Rhodobacterales]|uniref:DODA-type extradiol aromatic ring-opening family dioxygenase n=1 Tax=Rhodobacterales TaxID=204455 RepID=UPI00237F7DB2|nr:class III extradiol ring-cleavage dioxygenase [Phaeobacter gallaeciensis]MDE4140125.1 class III extradiol ring-cleavage dioxygenase [Phaeobacter gallaeciensis]MDE4148265.1 class III extradiol ring-cleavage dioxygenase [Phaeobacter gallaeciensis]MDE4152792.1 class III extradiol ring-cleavage dioxygenase [Phaeobacter gallaeciensis]MDE4227875.1 class III extradiol ring-cleavage dioxygenase [Phaeobacter gallaeciensis]MDE4257257.1 class III extradiol ring-cleavage dioxygenase [Phaeobacter gallae
MRSRMPSYFISHGGGPWPWIPNMREALAPLADALARMPQEIGRRPSAVLMISGHWEKDTFAVMSAAKPPMVYDYYNFPPETYEIQYPAPGAPELAQHTADLIAAAGLPVSMDAEQGYDHGTFVPMALMYPEADVPLFQVSMRHGYSPEEHFALGRALAPLRDEDVLIVGSGLSYHNLREFGPRAKVPSEEFDTWLNAALQLPAAARTEALLNWEQAPYARACHAQEDHLVPLFTALGAAEKEPATQVYHQKDIFGGVTASSFRFG